jgi:hypothetical protein
MLLIGWIVFFWIRIDEAEIFVALTVVAALHWALAGALMTGEIAELSPRVKRRLPQTQLGRLLFTWFNPGSGTGYVFAVSNLMAAMVIIWCALLFTPDGLQLLRQRGWIAFFVLTPSYVVAYLGFGRLLILAIRQFRFVGVYGGFLLQLILVMFGTLGPYVVQMIFSRALGYQYTGLQITNFFWTLLEVVDMRGRNLFSWPWTGGIALAVLAVPMAALGIFVLNLLFASGEVGQVRQAAPRRVREEDEPEGVVAAEPATPRSPFED